MNEKLELYAELVRSYAPRLNLISSSDLDQLEQRHIGDCLRLVPLVDELPPGPCVDVGSGAGLPGVPLACIVPDRRWVLLEPRSKRAAFLEEVVRQLALDATVVCARAEEASLQRQHRGSYVLATARAVAPPPDAFDLLRPFLSPGGVAAVFLGRGTTPPPDAELWREGVAIVRT